MRENAGDVLVPIPPAGRVFRTSRRVYVGDCGPEGRMRLDGLARVLQDAGGDDTADAGNPAGPGWVVRRTALEVVRAPTLREDIEVATFCGGTGRRWAERRTSISGPSGAAVEAASLWVHVDPATGRPAPLPDAFFDCYGEAAGGREVTARQRHALEVPGSARVAPWLVRAVDLDVLDHVNNAVGWAVLEQVRALAGAVGREGATGIRGEVEYRRSLERGDEVTLLWVGGSGGSNDVAADPAAVRCWLVTAAAARRVLDDGGGPVGPDDVFVTATARSLGG